MGESIRQWEEEDLCLASSHAGAQLPTEKPIFASFAGSQDWHFSCLHAGLISCVSC